MTHDDKDLLEYRLVLEKYQARAQALGLTELDADKVMARVILAFPDMSVLDHFKEAESRLPFAAMGLPETEYERIAARHLAEMEAETPLPGEIVLLRIQGIVGLLVWVLQAINGDFSKWTHAGIMLHGYTIFEAQPGGARITPWSKYEGRKFAIVTRQQKAQPPHELETMTLTVDERMRIDAIARTFEGAPYNWSTYFYLAAYRVGIRPRWLKDRVQRPDKLICSQAADEIYTQAEVHLFKDGRMPCDITPGDLARLTWS